MPPTLQAALLPLVVAALTVFAGWLKIDAKTNADNILVIATSLVAAIMGTVAYIRSIINAKKAIGSDLAEQRVEGITKPEGPSAPVTIIKNNPESPEPPVIITRDTHNDLQDP